MRRVFVWFLPIILFYCFLLVLYVCLVPIGKTCLDTLYSVYYAAWFTPGLICISYCFTNWCFTHIFRAVNGSEQWPLLRYFYQYFLARTAKQIVNRHRDILLSDEIIARYNLDVNAIFSAKSLVTFDELYTRYLLLYHTLVILFYSTYFYTVIWFCSSSLDETVINGRDPEREKNKNYFLYDRCNFIFVSTSLS